MSDHENYQPDPSNDQTITGRLAKLERALDALEKAFAADCRTDPIYRVGPGSVKIAINEVRHWLADYESRTGATGSISPPTQNAE